LYLTQKPVVPIHPVAEINLLLRGASSKGSSWST
jgi:hypothetical protein